MAATHWIDANAYGIRIAQLHQAASDRNAINAQNALNTLTAWIDAQHVAQSNYRQSLQNIDAQFSALQKDLANARKKPLPVDCKPDAGRMSVFAAAIAAANNTANIKP
jgi:hypothetical protein